MYEVMTIPTISHLPWNFENWNKYWKGFLLRPGHCCRVLGLFWTFHIYTTMLNAYPTIFCFQILGLLSSFRFVWINLTRCTKKKIKFFNTDSNFQILKADEISLESSSFVHCEYCIFKLLSAKINFFYILQLRRH